jgi:chromosome segregation ATPase
MEGDSQQWFTYAALGERLRVSPEAVRARAIRQAWRRQPGNDGKTLVQPPPEILHTPVQRAINGRAPPVRRAGDQATLTALREHISTLREDNERLRGDLTAEKERADRAVVELKGNVARLEGELAHAQANADRATAELKIDLERLTTELAGERTARRADQAQHQEQLAAERAARQADQEHAAARQADQEQQLVAARAAADRATAELVELARRLAAIAETQSSAETAAAEPETKRRSAAGRAWRWFLRN